MSKQVQGYSCNICGKYSGDLTKAKAHMEVEHFPSSTGYTCHCCERWFKTKNALSIHMSREHRDRLWKWTLWIDSPGNALNQSLHSGTLTSPEELLNFCEKEEGGRGWWTCSLCYQIAHRSRQNLRNHVESKHFPGHFSYNCNHCGKTFKSKNTLCVHVSQMHRG